MNNIEFREFENLPENLKEIMEKRGFFEISNVDEGYNKPILYFFPRPIRHKLKEKFELTQEPDFAIIQWWVLFVENEEILPEKWKKLKFTLYTLEQNSNWEWYFKTLENSVSNTQKWSRRNVAWIMTMQPKFFIPEQFPPFEVVRKMTGNKISYQWKAFIYHGIKNEN